MSMETERATEEGQPCYGSRILHFSRTPANRNPPNVSYLTSLFHMSQFHIRQANTASYSRFQTRSGSGHLHPNLCCEFCCPYFSLLWKPIMVDLPQKPQPVLWMFTGPSFPWRGDILMPGQNVPLINPSCPSRVQSAVFLWLFKEMNSYKGLTET